MRTQILLLWVAVWVTCVSGHNGDHPHPQPHPHPHPQPTHTHPPNPNTQLKTSNTQPRSPQNQPTNHVTQMSTSITQPTNSQTQPTASQTQSTSRVSQTRTLETTAREDDRKRNKRQWYPSGLYPGPHLGPMLEPSRDRIGAWNERRNSGRMGPDDMRNRNTGFRGGYWGPQIPMSELIRYQKMTTEQWQHYDWLWDQWRRNQGRSYPGRQASPLTNSMRALPGPEFPGSRYPWPLPDPRMPWRYPYGYGHPYY